MQRTPYFHPLRVTRSLAVVAALALPGCELGSSLEGLGSGFVDPMNTTVDAPGTRLTPTNKESPLYSTGYGNMSFQGSTTDGSFLLATTAATKDEANNSVPGELIVIPFGQRAKQSLSAIDAAIEGCSVGPVFQFSGPVPPPSGYDDAFTAKLPYLSAVPGETTSVLHFADLACRVADVELSGVEAVLSKFTDEGDFVAQTTDGALWSINPWTLEKHRITKQASAIGGSRAEFWLGPNGERWMWSIEDAEVVVRDTSYQEQWRIGENIANWTVTGDGTPSMRMLLRTEDNTLLSFLVAKREELDLIAEDACDERFYSEHRGLETLFFSPCKARDLKLFSFESKEVTVLATNVDGYRVEADLAGGPVLLYSTNGGEGDAANAVFGRWGQKEPIALGHRCNFKLSNLWSDGRRRLVLNWGDSGGDLYYGDASGAEAKLLTSRVKEMGGRWVLAEVEAGVGQLYTLESSDLQLFHKDVAQGSLRTDNKQGRALFVADYDGKYGTLYLVDGDDERPLLDKVRPGPYSYTNGIDAITVLSGDGSELHVHDTRSESDVPVNTHVYLAFETGWPEEGLLYITGGEDPAIYFTRFIP